MQVMDADHSVDDFIKYTDVLEQKMAFFDDELKPMVLKNLEFFPG